MAKSKTTLDDLAAMMQRGLSEVHEKMDQGFAAVGERFDAMDERFEKLEYRMSLVELSVKELRGEVARLTKLIEKSLNAEEIVDLKRRLTKFEAELATR